MSVSIEIAGPCRRKLRIEVSAERAAGRRAELLREFRQVATIPGFRPGKAPEPMVEKRYGREIDEETRRSLIADSYREAVAEQKLRVIGPPKIEDVEWQPGQPLTYTAIVEVAPEFTLPDYKGIVVQRREITVSDEDVVAMLESLRDQQADFVTVEGRGLKTGDFAVIHYTGVADGKPIAELLPENQKLGSDQNFWLLVEQDSFLPGFCEQLLGAQPGEKRQVFVTFPADFPEKPLAGRNATYFVDVVGIREKKLPALDDDFAKKMGAESLEKLREVVREQILHEREAERDAEMRDQLVDQLVQRAQFDLPESLLAAETRSIIYDLVRANTLRGVSRDELERQKQAIFSYAAQNARARLRASFILEAIADKEGIEVADAELNERIARLARRRRTTPEQLRAQLIERNELEQLRDEVRLSKTLDFLMAHAKVEPAK
ncbi:MAG: trigger factor [Verrucomicrobiae bacterium]|nr:trigger factor [Verrucomicrobiae bacterium]